MTKKRIIYSSILVVIMLFTITIIYKTNFTFITEFYGNNHTTLYGINNRVFGKDVNSSDKYDKIDSLTIEFSGTDDYICIHKDLIGLNNSNEVIIDEKAIIVIPEGWKLIETQEETNIYFHEIINSAKKQLSPIEIEFFIAKWNEDKGFDFENYINKSINIMISNDKTCSLISKSIFPNSKVANIITKSISKNNLEIILIQKYLLVDNNLYSFNFSIEKQYYFILEDFISIFFSKISLVK